MLHPGPTASRNWKNTVNRQAERKFRQHEEPTTAETFLPKHACISEPKAEVVRKDRRRRLTQSKLVPGAESTAHPRPSLQATWARNPSRAPPQAHGGRAAGARSRPAPGARDRQGFYERGQRRPSRGHGAGVCRCADRHGLRCGVGRVAGRSGRRTGSSSSGSAERCTPRPPLQLLRPPQDAAPFISSEGARKYVYPSI